MRGTHVENLVSFVQRIQRLAPQHGLVQLATSYSSRRSQGSSKDCVKNQVPDDFRVELSSMPKLRVANLNLDTASMVLGDSVKPSKVTQEIQSDHAYHPLKLTLRETAGERRPSFVLLYAW